MTESRPAAEYLRMSTEHQQYSIDNQKAAIREYAIRNNFNIVKTFVDEGKSGLILRYRNGLQQLLRQIVEYSGAFCAVLVYDVSRWGRFQDMDEAACYEFLCKRAGVPVHYCAEPFRNDGAMPNMVTKALKRVMAGEYSRELSVKSFDGAQRMVKEASGRAAGQVMVLSGIVAADGKIKGTLKDGETKNVKSDHVRIAPGHGTKLR